METRPARAKRATTRAALRKRAALASRYARGHRRPRRRTRLLALLIRAAAIGLILGAAVVLAEQLGSGARSLAASMQQGFAGLFSVPEVPARGAAPSPGSPLATAPILDSLERITREPRFVVSGRLPAFGFEGERPRVEILVNGALAASPSTDDRGRFSATVVLVPGPNLIRVASVRIGVRAESETKSVVLDTEPPPLALRAPADGATVEGAFVAVDGTTEVGGSVSINGNAVGVAFDGSFSGTVPVQSTGPLAIEVIARDAAGNETKQRVSVTVKPSPSASVTLGVSVGLDHAKVKPGDPVVADIVVTGPSGPVRDAVVSVSVALAGVGPGRTDSAGRYRVSFNAPDVEGIVQVIAFASSTTTSGRGAATLEVAKTEASPSPKP